MKVFFLVLLWPCFCAALLSEFGDNTSEEFLLLRNEIKALSDRVKDNEYEIGQLKNKIFELEDSKAVSENLSDGPVTNQPDLSTSEDAPSNRTIEDRVEKLEQLASLYTLRSCEEYFGFGLTASGLFTIDPDGPLTGNNPFDVFCSFEDGKRTKKA